MDDSGMDHGDMDMGGEKCSMNASCKDSIECCLD